MLLIFPTRDSFERSAETVTGILHVQLNSDTVPGMFTRSADESGK